jgi:hypothetical protein
VKIAILGAGVSGLALARTLGEHGFPLADLTLFEADVVVGGLCRSKTVEGFTYDVAGGHILFSKDRAVMQWMKDCAGGDDAFVRRDRHTKIRFGNRFVHYPFENGLGDLPEQPKFECLKGYVEAWHARDKQRTTAPGDPLSGANCVMIGFGAAARTGGWNMSNKASGRTILLSQSVDALDKTANNINLLLTGDCMLFDKLVPFNVYASGFQKINLFANLGNWDPRIFGSVGDQEPLLQRDG